MSETAIGVIASDDASTARQRRALGVAEAVNSIDRNKASYDGDFWHDYDLTCLSIDLIKKVALRMGVSAGMRVDDAVQTAASYAERQAPSAPDSQLLTVGSRVVSSLLRQEVVDDHYLELTKEGPQPRSHRFRLLYVEADAESGVEHLRASAEAINLLLSGALELNLADAQEAAEWQMQKLVERGALRDAATLAESNRFRSVQFLEEIRKSTARALLSLGTDAYSPEFQKQLSDALIHVQKRREAEGELASAVAGQRDALDDPNKLAEDRSKLAEANLLLSVLADCSQRHSELNVYLLGARETIREALNRHFDRPWDLKPRRDLHRDLLLPYASSSVEKAVDHAESLVAATGGNAWRTWPELSVLIDELCAPETETVLGAIIQTPEFNGTPDPDTRAVANDTCETMLDSLDAPTRLHELITSVTKVEVTDNTGTAVPPAVLRKAMCHAVHRCRVTRIAGTNPGDRVLIAVTSGDVFDDGEVVSDDLIVVPAFFASEDQYATRRDEGAQP